MTAELIHVKAWRVTLTITNDGESPARLNLRAFISSGKIMFPIFTLESLGVKARFAYPIPKVSAATDPVLILDPGEYVSEEIDLSEFYLVHSSAIYQVTYVARHLQEDGTLFETKSNTIEIHIA